MPRKALLVLVTSCLFCFALSVAAAGLSLTPRFEPGDRYQLSLQSQTKTAALSRAPEHRSFDESVRLDYRATVVVLETDGSGRPVRELHQNVDLRFSRPSASRSLFQEGASYEVRRGHGDMQIFIGDRRAPADVERVVVDLLKNRFDREAFTSWIEPGRTVEVGETWELDGSSARRLLSDRGIHVRGFDGPPTATLEANGSSLLVRYRIPLGRVELDEMPPNTETAKSHSVYEGQIELPGDSGHMAHSSNFAFDIQGGVWNSGVAPSFAWRMEREHSTVQQIQMIERVASTQ